MKNKTQTNAVEILPPELVREIQKYIQGQNLYIPKAEPKAPWGAKSGTREELVKRNNEIMELYQSGTSVSEISEIYFLSEDGIRTILRNR